MILYYYSRACYFLSLFSCLMVVVIGNSYTSHEKNSRVQEDDSLPWYTSLSLSPLPCIFFLISVLYLISFRYRNNGYGGKILGPLLRRNHDKKRTRYPSGVAYIDGEYVPMEQAKISILDWGFLRSDATYDVVHVWKGRFFRLDAHLDRFQRSIEKLKLTLPVSRQELSHILAECVRRSGLEDSYVEMIVTRGTSPTFSRDPRDAVNQLMCFSIPFSWILKPEDRERGLSVAISDIRRIDPASVDPTVKNYHWLDLVMGLYDAYERDATTVILTDERKNLTEGPGFNVFVVKNRQIATPDRGMLEGITRRSIMDLAQELEIPLEERPVSADEARAADEVFISSTAGGIMPVTRLDGAPVGLGVMGPITRRLLEVYWAKHSDPAWSTSVNEI